MKIDLKELIAVLRERYHVQVGSFQDCCVTELRLMERYEPERWSEENVLHLIRVRSLAQVAPQPVRVPVLCVVPAANLTNPSKPVLGNGTFIVAVADDFEQFLVYLSGVFYRCGQRSGRLDELSGVLLKCHTLEETLAVGEKWLKNPLVVTDHHQLILACSTLTVPENRNLFALGDMFSESASVTAMLEVMEESIGSGWPAAGEVDVPFLCKTLASGGHMYGNLILCALRRDISPEDAALLEILGNYCMLLIRELQLQNSGKTNREPLGYLLQMLLEETGVSRSDIEKYIDQSELRLKQYRYILSVIPADDMPAVSAPVHRLVDILSGVIPGCYGTYFQNMLTLVIESDREIRDFSREWEKLERVCSEYRMRAGISNACRDVMNIREYFFQSQRAAKIGRLIAPEQVFFPYYQCVPYHILDLASTYEDPVHFCDPRVLDLYKKDQENNTELLRTLQVYLDCGRNKAQTARELYIHINTVKYRLNQINELVSLQNGGMEEELRLHLSILTLRYIHEVREKGKI